MTKNEVSCPYETIADEFPIGVWRADSQGKLLFINDKLKNYFTECKIGQPFSSLIHDPATRMEFIGNWSGEIPYSFEFEDKDTEKWYRLTVHQVDNFYIGTILNITSEKILIPMLMSFKNEKISF